jgi:response regulator RpfG family c-di-GMP phosphodiesterase
MFWAFFRSSTPRTRKTDPGLQPDRRKGDAPFRRHRRRGAGTGPDDPAMILRMIRMAEMRDPKETGAHVNRVAGFSLEIYEHWAKRRNIDQKEIDKTRDVLRMGAMLHDVGKVATPI